MKKKVITAVVIVFVLSIIISIFALSNIDKLMDMAGFGNKKEETTEAETTQEVTTAEETTEEPQTEATTPAIVEKTTEDTTEETTEAGNGLAEYVGKPLTEFMSKIDEVGYTATYYADGVDFTEFIDLMKDDYTVGDLEIDDGKKTVVVTLSLTENIENKEAEDALRKKLEEGTAWVAAEKYGKEQFGKDFDLNYYIGKIYAGAEDEDTWFLKAECSINGVDKTCEAKVTGTTDSPIVVFFDVY